MVHITTLLLGPRRGLRLGLFLQPQSNGCRTSPATKQSASARTVGADTVAPDSVRGTIRALLDFTEENIYEDLLLTSLMSSSAE